MNKYHSIIKFNNPIRKLFLYFVDMKGNCDWKPNECNLWGKKENKHLKMLRPEFKRKRKFIFDSTESQWKAQPPSST